MWPREVTLHCYLLILTSFFVWFCFGVFLFTLQPILSFCHLAQSLRFERDTGRGAACPAEKPVRQDERPESGLVGVKETLRQNQGLDGGHGALPHVLQPKILPEPGSASAAAHFGGDRGG